MSVDIKKRKVPQSISREKAFKEYFLKIAKLVASKIL